VQQLSAREWLEEVGGMSENNCGCEICKAGPGDHLFDCPARISGLEEQLKILQLVTEERGQRAADLLRDKCALSFALKSLIEHLRKVEKWPKDDRHMTLLEKAEAALRGGKEENHG
jgi:hypothetical protein